MPSSRIFQKYDVVDNRHFSQIAAKTRQNAVLYRNRLQLPENYFLASSRFIPKKNLIRLLEAYSLYISKANVQAWDLVLLGDGEMRLLLTNLIMKHNLQDKVFMPGFKQYHELPGYYGLAKAFIHASTSEQWGLVVNEAMASGLPILLSNRCGCVRDLIVPGENGFLFDPFDIDDMAAKMTALSSGLYDLDYLSKRSVEIIENFTPEAFACNLKDAAICAVSTKTNSYSLMNAMTLSLLMR
jgi:glycosyltransferase involved in cell wall biosynthesis